MITLPYLLGVRRRYPGAELHFLTREEVAAVPKAMTQGLEICKFGDNRCLTRYSAAQVLERAETLARAPVG